MANFPKMKLTNAGLELLANVQAGADNLTFTKTVLGDGEVSTPIVNLKSLVSPKIEIAITEGKQVGTSTYQIGAFFSNTEITTGFWWREIGVFAKGNDGNEILYCYSNAGDAGDYIPVGSDERVEKYIYQSLAIGNAENVTAEIDETDSFILKTDKGKAGGVAPLGADGKVGAEYLPEMDYASTAEVVRIKSDLSAHLAAKNPHGITAATVGLENVPNVATNDQTPTYTEASTLTNLTSGEKLGIAFGKIKKAITDLISHLADTTKHITSTERTTWNGKAPNSHASTATTYGVGTESNYGHLKITDSKTSTATDTAASAKALKETYETAQSGVWKIIKEVDIALNTNGGTSVAIDLSSIAEHSYSELRMIFEGDITMTATANGDYVGDVRLSCGATDNNHSLAMFYGQIVPSRKAGQVWNINNIVGEMYAEKLQYYTYTENAINTGEIRTSSVQSNVLACKGRQFSLPVILNATDFKLILSTNKNDITVTATGTLKIYKRG